MARKALPGEPGCPHYVRLRGNRRQRTLAGEVDYRDYLEVFSGTAVRNGVEIWAYCLMPNDVHLVLRPRGRCSLADLIAGAHGRYGQLKNQRVGWNGPLWQARFQASSLGPRSISAAARYVETVPVRAQLCARPADWRWSSVHAHLAGRDDGVVRVGPLLERVQSWQRYLDQSLAHFVPEQGREYPPAGWGGGFDTLVNRLRRLATGATGKRH